MAFRTYKEPHIDDGCMKRAPPLEKRSASPGPPVRCSLTIERDTMVVLQIGQKEGVERKGHPSLRADIRRGQC